MVVMNNETRIEKDMCLVLTADNVWLQTRTLLLGNVWKNQTHRIRPV